MIGTAHRTLAWRAGGPGDYDAGRAGALLAAYFELSEAQARRRRTWRVAGIAVLALGLFASATTALTIVDLVFAGVLLALPVGTATFVEWRCQERLAALTSRPNGA